MTPQDLQPHLQLSKWTIGGHQTEQWVDIPVSRQQDHVSSLSRLSTYLAHLPVLAAAGGASAVLDGGVWGCGVLTVGMP